MHRIHEDHSQLEEQDKYYWGPSYILVKLMSHLNYTTEERSKRRKCKIIFLI